MNYSFVQNYKSNDFISPGLTSFETVQNKIKDTNYETPLYQEQNDNWGNYENDILKNRIEKTPLGELFFSRANVSRIQKMIKKAVFDRTNGKYKLTADQNLSDLLIVMRGCYLDDAQNNPYQIVHQVKVLNHKTLERIAPDLVSNLIQNQNYIEQLDKPIDPIPLPVNVNNKGRKAMPSISNIFFKF
jgi:hypothetical protein